MNRFLATATVCLLPLAAAGQSGAPQFKDMFNGRDLSGWVNINTAEDTWKFRDGVLVCSGRPLGVMCSEKQYENFVLHIEWKHMEAGGNSGVFVWSAARPDPQSRLPDGVEVQMLELEWPNLNKRNGVTPPVAYVHGELFGVGGVKTTPDTPRGDRSRAIRPGPASHVYQVRTRKVQVRRGAQGVVGAAALGADPPPHGWTTSTLPVVPSV